MRKCWYNHDKVEKRYFSIQSVATIVDVSHWMIRKWMEEFSFKEQIKKNTRGAYVFDKQAIELLQRIKFHKVCHSLTTEETKIVLLNEIKINDDRFTVYDKKRKSEEFRIQSDNPMPRLGQRFKTGFLESLKRSAIKAVANDLQPAVVY